MADDEDHGKDPYIGNEGKDLAAIAITLLRRNLERLSRQNLEMTATAAQLSM